MDKLIYAQLHIVHMTPYAYPVITIRLAQSYAPPIQAIFKSVACPHCIFTYSLFIHSFIHSFDNIYRRKPILDQTMYRNMKSVQRKRNEDKPIPLRNHFERKRQSVLSKGYSKKENPSNTQTCSIKGTVISKHSATNYYASKPTSIKSRAMSI